MYAILPITTNVNLPTGKRNFWGLFSFKVWVSLSCCCFGCCYYLVKCTWTMHSKWTWHLYLDHLLLLLQLCSLLTCFWIPKFLLFSWSKFVSFQKAIYAEELGNKWNNIWFKQERDKNLRSNNATHADARHADLWLIVSQIATISLKSNYGTPKIFYNAIYL